MFTYASRDCPYLHFCFQLMHEGSCIAAQTWTNQSVTWILFQKSAHSLVLVMLDMLHLSAPSWALHPGWRASAYYTCTYVQYVYSRVCSCLFTVLYTTHTTVYSISFPFSIQTHSSKHHISLQMESVIQQWNTMVNAKVVTT